jgi:hypothetical protein
MDMAPEIAEFLSRLSPQERDEMMRMATIGMPSRSRAVGRTTSFQDLEDDIEGVDRLSLDPEELISRYGLPQPSSFPTPAEVRKEAKERATEVLVSDVS